jgi:hypothetical protein
MLATELAEYGILLSTYPSSSKRCYDHYIVGASLDLLLKFVRQPKSTVSASLFRGRACASCTERARRSQRRARALNRVDSAHLSTKRFLLLRALFARRGRNLCKVPHWPATARLDSPKISVILLCARHLFKATWRCVSACSSLHPSFNGPRAAAIVATRLYN